MAWFWLPETVHRAQAGTGMPFRNLPELLRRPGSRRVLVDRFRLLVRVRDLPDDVRAVRGAAVRVRRVADRLLLRGVRRARRGRAGRRSSGRSCSRLGDKPTFIARAGVLGRRTGRGDARAFGRRCSRSRWCRWRSAWASAIRRCRAWSAARRAATSRDACRARPSAVESLGRTMGPVWGNALAAALRRGHAVLSGAAFLALTLLLVAGHQVADD